jgi:hypothetical protein
MAHAVLAEPRVPSTVQAALAGRWGGPPWSTRPLASRAEVFGLDTSDENHDPDGSRPMGAGSSSTKG